MIYRLFVMSIIIVNRLNIIMLSLDSYFGLHNYY